MEEYWLIDEEKGIFLNEFCFSMEEYWLIDEEKGIFSNEFYFSMILESFLWEGKRLAQSPTPKEPHS